MIYEPGTWRAHKEVYAALMLKHALPANWSPLFVTGSLLLKDLTRSYSLWPEGDVLVDPSSIVEQLAEILESDD